ncbi:phage integrase SAM-like domain-containing protein [Ruegeria sp. Ofav3-42]|uniref:phage integrase SAM-like domain-containing protein n=1 Tax=Ruegeria sp. Ofav3-42 TaxID=2917759 RepID=UPI001EF52300|nr:phage integrase SAM-like domain-containing protein [Ruegeria sp. Ofav3-42]MCG7518452.1 phage integrase SAM-like domain-containing protein [Ruegeria sp. Ofav3-42]
MPKKNAIPYLKVSAKTGLCKYIRRVPEDLQQAVGRKVWEKRLGSDYTEAVRKCIKLTDEHDKLIEALSDPEAANAQIKRNEEEAFAKALDLRLALASGPAPNFSDPEMISKERWRNAETVMQSAAKESPPREREMLAGFMAYAFDDHSYIEAQPIEDPVALTLVRHMRPQRPTDTTGAMMFDALKGMVAARLRQLQRLAPSNSENTLMKLLERYKGLESLSDNTERAYRNGIQRFIDREGDLDARDITSRMLKDHRDHLIASGLEPTSIRTLFAGIGSVLSYAQDEEVIDANPALGLKFPRDKKSIEDRKQIPFKPDDVAKIWAAAQKRFAPDGKSRLSKDRRRAYLMCVKTLILTGMRPHEFFRLRDGDVSDVNKIDAYQDEWRGIGINICFSKSGNRLIPLPDGLSDLPAFINEGGLACVRDAEGKLIKDVVKNFSEKQFDPILTELKLKRPRVSLYSTRGTFNMAMKRQGVSKGIRQQIIGHKPDGKMMRHYTDPETMDSMADAMNIVSFW